MNGFSVTYEVVTPESAETGDYADSGYLADNVTFGEAMEAVRWYRGGYVEADCYPIQNPRRFTFIEAERDFATDSATHYTLHLPASVTPASRIRIARLLGCYGVR